MLTKKDKRKIKGFKSWLKRNEDLHVLGALADFMKPDRLTAVIKILEAKGYPLDECGIPALEESEDYKNLVFAVYGSFAEVTGRDLSWGLFAPYLEDLREWLIAVSELSEDPEWWHKVDWSRVNYETLGRIANGMYARGCPLDENGIPNNVIMGPKDPEWLWRALDEAVFEAIVANAYKS